MVWRDCAHNEPVLALIFAHSVGVNPLAVEHSFVAPLSTFLHTLWSFLPAMLCFLRPSPELMLVTRRFLPWFSTRKLLLEHAVKVHNRLHIQKKDGLMVIVINGEKLYLAGGYKKCHVWETNCLSASIFRDRSKKLATRGSTNSTGQPRELAGNESTTLKTYIDDVGGEGVGID